MDKLNSKRLKKILIGVILSDGSLNKRQRNARFDFYNKVKEYSEYLQKVLSYIPNLNPTLYEKYNKRYDVKGYRVFTKTHRYFTKLYDSFYCDNKKVLTKYILRRIDEESLAHIWMSDGMLHFMKHPERNSVQTCGYFCLECFSKEELTEFCKMLKLKFDINARLKKVRWGKGWRVKVSGYDLRKFISIIYPFILPSFLYKCNLYYKNEKILEEKLNNTEQFLTIYKNLSEIEDIIRTRRNT